MQEPDKENLVAEAVTVTVAAAQTIHDLVLEEAMVIIGVVLVQAIAAAVAHVKNKIQDFATSREEAEANLKNVGKLNNYI